MGEQPGDGLGPGQSPGPDSSRRSTSRVVPSAVSEAMETAARRRGAVGEPAHQEPHDVDDIGVVDVVHLTAALAAGADESGQLQLGEVLSSTSAGGSSKPLPAAATVAVPSVAFVVLRAAPV